MKILKCTDITPKCPESAVLFVCIPFGLPDQSRVLSLTLTKAPLFVSKPIRKWDSGCEPWTHPGDIAVLSRRHVALHLFQNVLQLNIIKPGVTFPTKHLCFAVKSHRNVIYSKQGFHKSYMHTSGFFSHSSKSNQLLKKIVIKFLAILITEYILSQPL